MGCRTHTWKSQTSTPSVSGLKVNLSIKSTKSEDITAKVNLPEYQYVNSDSDSSGSSGDLLSMKNMIIESQMVRCASKDEYPAVKTSQLENKFQRTEFRLPKLEFTDLMVSMLQY